MSAFVRLENPDTGGVWECPKDYEETARKRGWVDSDKPLPGEEDEELVEAPAYDPGKHTAAEVNAYLEERREDNPIEFERVLGAERAGKNRKSITGE